MHRQECNHRSQIIVRNFGSCCFRNSTKTSRGLKLVVQAWWQHTRFWEVSKMKDKTKTTVYNVLGKVHFKVFKTFFNQDQIKSDYSSSMQIAKSNLQNAKKSLKINLTPLNSMIFNTSSQTQLNFTPNPGSMLLQEQSLQRLKMQVSESFACTFFSRIHPKPCKGKHRFIEHHQNDVLD